MDDDPIMDKAKERFCIMAEQSDVSESDAIGYIREAYGADIADRVRYEYIKAPPSIDMLNCYLEHGIRLIPTKRMEDGRFIQLHTKEGGLLGVSDAKQLAYWVGKGVERFLFIPRDHGFLCLDIDRGHDNGGDGLEDFYSWLRKNYLEAIPYFKDLVGGSFPCYVKTPSGGFHLYFKCQSPLTLSQNITPNVEVKYGGKSLTASGSIKNGKQYIMHGTLSDAPAVPMAMIQKLSKRLDEELTRKPSTAPRATFQKKGYTDEQLLDFARKDSAGGNHNTIFQMAQRLKREGRSLEQAMAIIKATPEHQNRKDRNDTDSCIKSVYKD